MQADANASIYAGIVPWRNGMSRNEVNGITAHQSGMNQNGRPFIEFVTVLIR
jgi:hypothetical protein